MKRIPLTQGKFALVDDEDYEWLSQWKWYAHRGAHSWYARRNQKTSTGSITITMHRYLLGLSREEAPEIDHKDNNGLNNTRDNLRPATSSTNGQNRTRLRSNTSGFKGVHYHKPNKRWQARIVKDRIRRSLGLYATAEAAARAYDKAARELHGEYACLNFPKRGERAA
jgi:hypothetical protein